MGRTDRDLAPRSRAGPPACRIDHEVAPLVPDMLGPGHAGPDDPRAIRGDLPRRTDEFQVNGFVYFAVGVAALGGLLFGYDTGVISGAMLFIKDQFSLSAAMEEIVVSSVLVGAVLGAALGGALTGRFGRRGMIILAESSLPPARSARHWRRRLPGSLPPGS